MASFVRIPLGKHYEPILRRMDQHILDDVKWLPATARTPNAVWSDISDFLDPNVKTRVESVIGRPLHDIFWICDYRGCKTLEIHRDNPGNEYPIQSRFIVILMLRGRFEVTIWDDDQTTVLDRVVINPGELIVLNNSQYYHSGLALDPDKVSFHAYPIIPEIDDYPPLPEKFQVESYIKDPGQSKL